MIWYNALEFLSQITIGKAITKILIEQENLRLGGILPSTG